MSKKKHTNHPQKKRKKNHSKMRKAKTVLMIIIIAICAVIIGGFALLHVKYGINPKTIIQYKQEAKELVANSTVETFRPNKASMVYSDDDQLIAKLYENEESTYLSFDEIPKDVINAFVSVEDRTFWKNSGIDTKGIVRVFFNYIRTGGKTAHGASTITQQVARDIFLTNEKSLERKVKEIFIAQEMTKKYDKKLIIEFYCNNCCFANATYGIEDAAQTYLGKSASELSLSEAAYLCAIPNRPEYYDPFDDPTTALTRRDKILKDMVECEYITQAECDAAMAEEITVIEKKASKEEFHNYATTLTIKYATEYLMEYKYDFDFQYSFDSEEEYEAYQEEYDTVYSNAKHNLYTGGYQIYTSINLDAMDELQEVLDENLKWNKETKEDGVYNLQGALTVIDNETGKIVAAVGGRSQDVTANMYSLNRAVNSPRQPGSSIKPLIVYTPALEEGYNANSMLVNV
ncbi:MAG: transglycosylase domain-containing protein, partial [Agathobacter sp.]